jgi:mitogen-activated protein kinase organizer 1
MVTKSNVVRELLNDNLVHPSLGTLTIMAPATASAPIPTKLAHTLAGHKGPVNVARYNKGARYILTGGQDRQIKLWNAQTGKEIKTYAGHGYEVLGVDV